jgi:hypothetical protein
MEINTAELAQEVERAMRQYSDRIIQLTKQVVEETAEEAASDLRKTSPRRSGMYARSWTATESYENARTKRSTVHNRGHYQLTHLLEYGHALKRGGQVIGNVRAIPHIKPEEEKIKTEFERRLKEAVES